MAESTVQFRLRTLFVALLLFSVVAAINARVAIIITAYALPIGAAMYFVAFTSDADPLRGLLGWSIYAISMATGIALLFLAVS